MNYLSNSLKCVAMICLLLFNSRFSANALASDWKSLDDDGIHDPQNPALKRLQDPGKALRRLPSDNVGNKVDWVRAFNDGYINPRSSKTGSADVRMLDTEIIMNDTGSLPLVLFPHKQHTRWLDCENCHDRIFKSKAGATPITMSKILEGQYCGVCHGAVSFPLTECNRCHSVPLNGAQQKR